MRSLPLPAASLSPNQHPTSSTTTSTSRLVNKLQSRHHHSVSTSDYNINIVSRNPALSTTCQQFNQHQHQPFQSRLLHAFAFRNFYLIPPTVSTHLSGSSNLLQSNGYSMPLKSNHYAYTTTTSAAPHSS